MNATESALTTEQIAQAQEAEKQESDQVAPVQESEAPTARQPIIIDKGFPVFKHVNWVCKAISTDPSRIGMSGILIEEGGRILATDGSRLHMAENMPVWAPGFYTVAASAKQIVLQPVDGIQFPDWRRVVPDICKDEHKKCTVDLDDFDLNGHGEAAARAVFDLVTTTKAKINLKFLAHLKGFEWTVYSSGPEKAVVFTYGEQTKQSIFLKAVIMPMRRY